MGGAGVVRSTEHARFQRSLPLGNPRLHDFGWSSLYRAVHVATGFNKWGMTTSMVASMILSDLVHGRENLDAEVFSPSRTICRPQLFINGFEAAVNLLTPTKPRCPYMGCALKWNPQEHSWDCPCHGSRFAKNGSMQDNPATGDRKNRR